MRKYAMSAKNGVPFATATKRKYGPRRREGLSICSARDWPDAVRHFPEWLHPSRSEASAVVNKITTLYESHRPISAKDAASTPYP
jgi:hypothetical protein